MLKKYASIALMQQDGTKQDRFLFAYRNVVYDLTPFVDEHPGGRFSLQTFRGKDLENILFNASIHRHQASVLAALEQYKYGTIEVKKPLENKSKSTDVPKMKEDKSPHKKEQKSKAQIQDDRTQKSNLTTSISDISGGINSGKYLSPDFHPQITQNKTPPTSSSNITPHKSAMKKPKETIEIQNKSQIIDTNKKKANQLIPSIIKEEEESQQVSPLLQTDLQVIQDEILNLQIPILNYKLVGFVKRKLNHDYL